MALNALTCADVRGWLAKWTRSVSPPGSRYWEPAKSSGLAVVGIPSDHVQALGGLKQQRARGSLSETDFTLVVMPAGNGRLALRVSRR
jgi:hypothetical protein